MVRCSGIELNPVAAGMVTTPDEYRWSSYGCHAWGKTNTLITDHPIFEALSQSIQERQHAYRELFRFQLPDADIHQIRESLNCNYPLGNDRFRAEIESALGRQVGQITRGRPLSGKASSNC